MSTSLRIKLFAAFAGLFFATSASADGTEVLGTPSIAIANGTGVVSGGTGLLSQPGSIELEVPVGASVEQVLLYWEGFMLSGAGDDTVFVSNGGVPTMVTGTLIGGPTVFFAGAVASTFRADITSLGLVTDGLNTIIVDDLFYTAASNGAGIMVVFDDGSSDASIEIRDGSDVAWFGFEPPLDATVPQTYSFAASTSDRTANLDMFFASVAGSLSGGTIRPTVIEIRVTGPGIDELTKLDNVLDSVDGGEWDSFKIAVALPAGSNTLTVQTFSRDDLGIGANPASFDWIGAALSIEAETPPGVPGRMTGGGSVFRVDNVRVTRGFQIHCDLRDPNNIQVNWPGNRFHLQDLTGAVCTDSPLINQLPRSAPFDTFQGEGDGLLNGEAGARIEFVFVDAGEPGREDTASIQVFDSDNNMVLDVSGFLRKGNIQAHKDNQSEL